MARSDRALAVRALGWLLGSALLGCAPEPSVLEPTTESLTEHVFAPHCGTSGCHSHPDPVQGLDLSSTDAVLRTAISRPATVGSAPRLYAAIVAPGDPDGSFLLAKITLPGADEGVPMPPSEWMLDEETVAVVRAWIANMPRGAR